MKNIRSLYYNTSMLDIISTFSICLLIIVEIILTVFCVKKICFLENCVDEIHLKMLEKAKEILELNDEINKILKKINKVIRIISNKKFHQIKRLIMMIIDIIQMIFLLKSLNLSKGLKSVDFKLLRKIAYLKVGQQIFKKVLDFAQNLCAI